MDEDATTNRTKWSLVEVKGTLEKFPHTNPWVESGLTKKFEGEFSLCQKKIPKVRWKCRVDTSQNCKEVVLAHANSVFRLVAVMHIRWDELELGMPLEGDNFLVSCTGLIVKDLEINCKTSGC